MNNTYYETLDKNFKEAVALVEKDHSHDELIELLKHGNIPQKQLAAMRLDTINTPDEFDILLSNLTGQDGKIREAVSLRLADFLKNPNISKYINYKDYTDMLSEAIIDINGNICRNTIEAISNLKPYTEFCKTFCAKLVSKTHSLIDKIKTFDFKDGKYKVNKEVFKLYWCLEAIYTFADCIDINLIKQILLETKNIKEYTIREKTAKILSLNFDDTELQAARQELKEDSNYYVRRF